MRIHMLLSRIAQGTACQLEYLLQRWNLQHIDGAFAGDMQDHYELRICTWNQLSTRRKKPLGDTTPLLLMDCMRACACAPSCTLGDFAKSVGK